MALKLRELSQLFFAYRARLIGLEFKRLMKQGRLSLLVGLSFLIGCFLGAEFLSRGILSIRTGLTSKQEG